MNCRIWDSWAKEDGSLGRTYGHNLRNFGSIHYFSSGINASDGFDQLTYIVQRLKQDQTDRRIMFSLWDPHTLDKTTLPPCCYNFQIVVDDEGVMDGVVTSRSCDSPVGVPHNIAFYTTFLQLLCLECNFKPGVLVFNGTNYHIYENQIEKVEEYLQLPKFSCPKLEIEKQADIYNYKPEHFKLVDYKHGPKLDFPVAV
jgi:thymidylate synthase